MEGRRGGVGEVEEGVGGEGICCSQLKDILKLLDGRTSLHLDLQLGQHNVLLGLLGLPLREGLCGPSGPAS